MSWVRRTLLVFCVFTLPACGPRAESAQIQKGSNPPRSDCSQELPSDRKHDARTRPAGRGRIAGSVINDSGQYLDILVRAENENHVTESRTRNGTYELLGISDGIWKVSFFSDGVWYVRENIAVRNGRRVPVYAKLRRPARGCKVTLPARPELPPTGPPPRNR